MLAVNGVAGISAVGSTVIGKPLAREWAAASARISASSWSSNFSCTSRNSSMKAATAGTTLAAPG